MVVLAMRVVEVLFFTGLAGCVLVIVTSWFSIFKEIIFGTKDSE